MMFFIFVKTIFKKIKTLVGYKVGYYAPRMALNISSTSDAVLV